MLKILVVAVALTLPWNFLRANDTTPQLAQDNSTFAINLYHQLSGKEGNLFFSPYSISTALAMTSAGARGDTATQMAATLHFSLPSDQLNPSFATLRKQLKAAQGEGVKLTIANSIWPSNRYKFLDSYVTLLKSDYGVSVTPLDYTQPEAARTTINHWVETETQDKIKDLIGPGVLKPDTKLTLVNAIYFHGKWQSPFQPKYTEDGSFQVTPEKSEKVRLMRQTAPFAYADLDLAQLLELPYQGGDLSMLIVLPKAPDGLKTIESSLSLQTLSTWNAKLAKTKVIVRLPRFRMTWGTEDLTPSLQSLGMKNPFDPTQANFSGMDGNPRGLFIGGVLHQAFIDVQEEGTEAAAATAVGMVGSAAPEGPFFVANHPFLFLIRDNKTGSILFMGRVTDPKAGGASDAVGKTP